MTDSTSIAVAIASFRRVELLHSCLASIVPQAAALTAKVVVARAGTAERTELESRWPTVEFTWLPPGTELPRIRGAAMARASAAWVALTEDHCVADSGWLAGLRDAEPAGRVVGGVMDTTQTARGIDLGAFFAEYGFFARGAAQANSSLITGANVLYAGELAPQVAQWMTDGYWENVVHDRLRATGIPFGRAPNAVIKQNLTYAVGPFCRDRYQHGRDYGRARLLERRPNALGRLVLAVGAAGLPLLLFSRVARAVDPAAVGRFLRATPWTLLFLSAWSTGEFVAYCRGNPLGAAVDPAPTNRSP